MKLDLEQQEVQLVLNALANLPYGQVFQLVPKIVGQVNAQAQPVPAQEVPDGQASQ